jgi:23S rRNA (cytosine1962-C5)-methyltransferase
VKRLQLRKAAAQAVLRGHPWVLPDGFDGKLPQLKAGEEVVLLDALGGFCARALADGRQGWGPVVRVLTTDERAPPLRKLLFRRLAAAKALRDRVIEPGTTAFRLVHGEGDGLPGLVVDRYAGVLVVRPDSDAWARRTDALIDALRSEAGGCEAIVLKPKKGEAATLWGEAPEAVVVSEEGRKYRVRPGYGQKTGFFVDQRPNRTEVGKLVRPGDRCLNLFSFTGGFSVAMAVAGAQRVVSVDLSASILADCRAQFPLNGVDPEPHGFEAVDAFAWLPKLARSKRPPQFDLVVCDPPALAHKRDDLPAARQAYRRVHEALAPLVRKGGLLVTCSCTSRLGPDDLLDDARAGLRNGGRSVRAELRRAGAGPDHPVPPGFAEGRYLSVLTLALD